MSGFDTAYRKGAEAARSGKPFKACPYKVGQSRRRNSGTWSAVWRRYWQTGWRSVRRAGRGRVTDA